MVASTHKAVSEKRRMLVGLLRYAGSAGDNNNEAQQQELAWLPTSLAATSENKVSIKE